MSDLLLHPHTQNAFDDFISSPSQSLIIDGQIGSGKTSAAAHLVSKILALSAPQLDNNAKVRHLKPTNGTISIDDVRSIQEFVKLKTLGSSSVRRAIVIEESEALTREAQNSLLKLLEEPPADTVIVLTTSNLTSLLPTIRSRSQIIRIKSPKREASDVFFEVHGFDSAAIDKAYYISQGRVGLMQTILSGDSNELLDQINLAKQLLAMSKFERLLRVDALIKQKDSIDLFLQALETVCRAGLSQASERDRNDQVKRWHNSLAVVIDAHLNLFKQANTKLLITDLVLSL